MEISLKIQIFSVKEETSKVFFPYILIVVLSPLVVPTYILQTSRSTKSVRGELVWGFDDLNFNMSYYKNTRENRYEVKDIEDMFIFLKRIIACSLLTLLLNGIIITFELNTLILRKFKPRLFSKNLIIEAHNWQTSSILWSVKGSVIR